MSLSHWFICLGTESPCALLPSKKCWGKVSVSLPWDMLGCLTHVSLLVNSFFLPFSMYFQWPLNSDLYAKEADRQVIVNCRN